MDLAIVIVNWNTCDLTAQCLESIQAELASPGLALSGVEGDVTLKGRAETWVVDNHSTDDSAALLADRFPWVRLILNPENHGFAAGNNQGLRASTGRYILLLNSDTIVQPGALRTLVQFMDEHPVAAAAGSRILNADGTLQTSCYPAPTLGREFWRMFHLDRLYPLGVYPMERWPLEPPREVDNILGACMILRRDVIDRVGEMDESYFMYSEEIDWCLRIRQGGGKIYWVPQASITHLGGQSTRQLEQQMFLQLYRAKVAYFRKHYGRISAALYKGILIAASLFRLALAPISLLQSGAARQRSRALAQSYGQLLRALPGY